MQINGGGSTPIRPDAARDVRESDAGKAQGTASPAAARIDTVEISEAGRARAAEATGETATRAERLAEIRQRILRGAYDADEVVDAVARRILDRGDL